MISVYINSYSFQHKSPIIYTSPSVVQDAVAKKEIRMIANSVRETIKELREERDRLDTAIGRLRTILEA